MAERDDDAWFVPKAFGFGATPVTWQGWAMTVGSVVLLILDVRFVHAPALRVVLAIALIVLMVAISWHKTAGDWHWRWGSRD
jgi:hypothetical protein